MRPAGTITPVPRVHPTVGSGQLVLGAAGYSGNGLFKVIGQTGYQTSINDAVVCPVICKRQEGRCKRNGGNG